MSEREPSRESLNIPDEQEMEALFDADYEAIMGNDVASLRKHTEHAKALLGQHGWIDTTGMSDKAERGLYTSILHSDYDVEFQQQALEMLQSAVEAGEAPKNQFTFLTDRVRRNNAQPQLFGLYPYVLNEKSELVPAPIEDEDHIEERWKEYGVTGTRTPCASFAEYRQRDESFYADFFEENGVLPGYTIRVRGLSTPW